MENTIQPNIELIAEDEVFKTVVIYNDTYPNYLISNYGRVYSLKANKIKYFSIDNKGYTRFILSKNGKIKAISGHRLVAFAFVVNPNPNEYNTVNHMDESTTNNYWKNLEWCSKKHNLNWGATQVRRASKRYKPVRAYKADSKEFIGEFESMTKAAQACNTTQPTVSIGCKTGLPQMGYIFQYAS